MTEFIHACLQVPCQRHLSLLETSGIRLWRSRGLGCCIPEFEHLEKQTRLLPMLKEKLLCEFSSYLCFTPVTNKTACMFWTALSGHTWSSELLTTSISSKEKRGRSWGTEIWQRKNLRNIKGWRKWRYFKVIPLILNIQSYMAQINEISKSNQQ